jgi:hypothetical protein
MKEKSMSASAAVTNGKPRKQLSDQLDRLDSIIDVLAEGLPGAVTDACREGARAAVKDAIIEIVSNPELRALLTSMQPASVPVAPAPEPRKPSPWAKLRALLAAARDAVTRPVKSVRDAVATRCRAALDAVAAVGAATGEAIPARRILLVGLGVGVAVRLATLLVPQTVAAAVSAATTTATAVILQTGSWLRRAARRLGLLS